ncbi:MAG: hypothetical protein AABW48_01890 [Nanoarchaeota archaeon]
MKQSLATILAGASVIFYCGCSSENDSNQLVPTDAGAGGYGAGGNTSVGGNGGGAGGTGGNTGGYPKGVDSIKTHTSPEIMDLVDCIIGKHKELRAYEVEHPLEYGFDLRTGILMMGAVNCGECQQEREEIGIEGIKKLVDNGIYIDPFFDYESNMRAIDIGFEVIPSINIVKVDLLPTTEFPEGHPTMLTRRWEAFISLPTLAELTGCTYKGKQSR